MWLMGLIVGGWCWFCFLGMAGLEVSERVLGLGLSGAGSRFFGGGCGTWPFRF